MIVILEWLWLSIESVDEILMYELGGALIGAVLDDVLHKYGFGYPLVRSLLFVLFV